MALMTKIVLIILPLISINKIRIIINIVDTVRNPMTNIGITITTTIKDISIHIEGIGGLGMNGRNTKKNIGTNTKTENTIERTNI